MAPIYDTDVAEERWSKGEWLHYELWEKVEHRIRRKRQIWIGSTVLVFLALSSIPIVIRHWPKWTAQLAARKLAQELNGVKRSASVERNAYRVRFDGSGALSFVIEKAETCAAKQFTPVRSGRLLGRRGGELLSIVPPEHGGEAGTPSLVNQFCYDSHAGGEFPAAGHDSVAFGIMPVKDLTERGEDSWDRLAVVVLTGPSAEISFE